MAWADHHRDDGHKRPLAPGAVRKGVTLTEMPAPKPDIAPQHVKGVAGPTSAADEDHRPGGGTWRPVT